MKGLSSYKKEPVHTRTITIATYPAGEHAIMVEGRLRDERLVDIFSITTAEKIPPGVVHDMMLRLLVRGPDLSIEDLEVEFIHVPRDACRETENCLRPLLGRRISQGFTSYVKKHFGGPCGCTHLTALLIAMAPAAVQGFWNQAVTRKMSSADAAHVMDTNLLVDSCWVWRSDGPMVEEFTRVLSDRGTPGGMGKPQGKGGMEDK